MFASSLFGGQATPATRAACAECHPAVARAYSTTPMALSSGETAGGLPWHEIDGNSFTDKKSAFVYTAGRDGSGYFLDFRRNEHTGQPSERRRLPYFIGSGTDAVAFLISIDGFLYESPATWYRRTSAWDFSPGYESYSYPFLTRAVVPGCLECHASGVLAIAGTQNGYRSPPFLDGGVACERCHGSGDLHVSRMKGKQIEGVGPGILNPVKLTPERRDSICAQCHLTGEVIVEKADRRHRAFTPGDRLQDHSVAFTRSSAGSLTRVASHVENLAQSMCKRVSGDRLWCGTCHDPHSVPAPGQRAEWFRSKCLICHAASGCGGELAARTAVRDDCTQCHMPRNSVLDANHVVHTDHSIPRLQAKRPNAKAPADAPLVPFGQAAADARDLGLAYAIVAARERNKAYAERAFPLLRQAIAKSPNDSQVLSYLADLYKKRSNDAMAVQLYQRLLLADQSDSSAPAALGAYALERGDNDEAIRLWSDALRKSPALLLVRANLAVALLRAGQPGRAEAVLKKALEFNPNFTAARDLLDKIQP